MIRHTVAFKLKHQKGSREESEFLDAAKELASIPIVKKFECLKEIGEKNDFEFGLSMEFESMVEYNGYKVHSKHIRFVEDIWVLEVVDYIEIDYEF